MPTCTSFIQPLNLECLFINTFSETTAIFFFVALFVFAGLAAMFRMSNLVVISMLVLFSILTFTFVGGIATTIILLILIIAVIVIARLFRKLIE